MIPCRERRCLACHPRLAIILPSAADPVPIAYALRVLIARDDLPCVVVPEGRRIEPIADLPATPPAGRC